MHQRFVLLLLMLFFSTSISAVLPSKMVICTDNNFWYPFSFLKDKKAAGLHIDIIEHALHQAGYQVEFKPLAWKQCLKEVKEGKVDAVATAAFTETRAQYLLFPPGAADDKESPWRVTQVDWVVVTPRVDPRGKANSYVFSGDPQTLPQPVRLVRGYALAEALKKWLLIVDEADSSEANFRKLIREHQGSVIDLELTAKRYNFSPEFNGKMILHTLPLTSKSYYLAFSKKLKAKNIKPQQIWQEIVNVRDDVERRAEFMKKYQR